MLEWGATVEIRRLSLVSGAREATGLAVVIDVFRAFTTAAYVVANGAECIHPVGSVEEAFELRRLHPGWVLMGERGGVRVEGFDYGNSPAEVMGVDFSGRTVVQSTSAGTRGLVAAVDAELWVLGSFVTAGAIADYIRRVDPGVVSLVAMGVGGRVASVEDELCAEYLEGLLVGGEPDFEGMVERIRGDPEGVKFFDPGQTQFVEGDFYAAMDRDRFGFALRAVVEEGLLTVRAV